MPPLSTPAVEASALVKTYPGGRRQPPVSALAGLSLQIAPGTVYGLLGPNGAGKSTATRILTTLARPDSGSARVAGYDVGTDTDGVRRRIGYVSQGTAADPLQTPAENLQLAGRLRGLSRADAADRSRDLIGQFDLAEHADRRAGTLSGGTRRKLDVAIGLVHTPTVLFLDEPTTGLDPEARAAMWAEIRRLAGEAALTVVLTTHYLEEADELADRLLIIDHGRAVIDGSPTELKATLAGDTLSVDLPEPDERAVRDMLAGLPELRDAVVEVRGTAGRLIARTADAPALIGRTIAALDAAGIAFGAVSVSRPTLDDVYLHYAGRSYDAGTPATPKETR